MITRRRFVRLSGTAGFAALAFPKRGFSSSHAVTVRASRPLGSASQIADFLGAGGDLWRHSTDPNDPVTRAWRRLGMRHITFETLHLPEWIGVRRAPGGAIEVDFNGYDRFLESYRTHLQAEPFIYLGEIPKALSSRPDAPRFEIYAPRDLREWEQFVAAIVRHNIERFGWRGLTYGTRGEPDHPDSWKGSGTSTDAAQLLREHVEFYAATERAVKSVDPAARVGAPATMNWQRTALTAEAPFVLADWIRALADYNRSVDAGRRAGLDYVCWQDYGWSSHSIHDGAEAVSQMLAANGFAASTPKMLVGSGWGSWSSDYIDHSLPLHARAWHLLHNITGEFKDPQQRRFARAYYYYFFDWDGAGVPEGDQVKLVGIRPDGTLRFTPVYAAFEMIRELALGSAQILETMAASPIDVIAVHDRAAPQRIKLAVANGRAESATLGITIEQSPLAGSNVVLGIQQIDSNRSADGAGLEPTRWQRLGVSPASLRIDVSLPPYGSALLTLSPAASRRRAART